MADEENIRKAANLLAWRKSGRGLAWVIGHNGQWNHDDWTRLLDDLKASDFWPVAPDAVGGSLEEWKLTYDATPLRLFANAPWAMTKHVLRKAMRPVPVVHFPLRRRGMTISAKGLVVFGTTIGLLAALSSAAGTTSALIGLLFALVGGSILTWFDKNKVATAQIPMLTESAGWIGGGIMLGVLLGITLRWLDQRYIEPDVAQHRLEAEAKALGPTLAKLDSLMAKADESNKMSSETDKAITRQLETLKSSLESLPKASKTGSVVELHGIRTDELVKLASLLHRDLEVMKPENPEFKKVSDLEAAVKAVIALKGEKDLRAAYPTLKDDTVDQLREVTK